MVKYDDESLEYDNNDSNLEYKDDNASIYHNMNKYDKYKKCLSDLYYSFVVGENQDMVVGPDDNVTFFEIKIVPRKYAWNPQTQSFNKIVTRSKVRMKRDPTKLKEEDKNTKKDELV